LKKHKKIIWRNNMKKEFSFIAFVTVFAILLASCSNQDSDNWTEDFLEIVNVTGGKISGAPANTEDITIFKGIPYAAPPVGDLRWKAPAAVIPWEGVKACNAFSAICPQPDSSSGGYEEEFYADGWPEMDEDCLYLNVWTPAKVSTENLPVMVWLHGGGNAAGWSYEKEFDGEGIAGRGVILVTANYRLGVLGFLAHPELSAEAPYKSSGNYGLLDQIAALRWVHDNIDAFGGNPDNVTLFGQSAGAIDISTLICSDMTRGLVHKAIFQSGGMMGTSTSLETQEGRGETFVSQLGKSSIEELRAMTAEELVQGRTTHGLQVDVCVDGYIITTAANDLYSAGKYLDIPYLIGANKDDLISYDFFGAGTTTLGDLQLSLGRTPIYGYKFIRELPGGGDTYTTGAFHSSELWYVFETLDRCWRPFTEWDYALAKQIASYWTNFAKTGNPNGEGLTNWVPYTEPDKNIQELGF
jgi:para-nitrobenzyl esterase